MRAANELTSTTWCRTAGPVMPSGDRDAPPTAPARSPARATAAAQSPNRRTSATARWRTARRQHGRLANHGCQAGRRQRRIHLYPQYASDPPVFSVVSDNGTSLVVHDAVGEVVVPKQAKHIVTLDDLATDIVLGIGRTPVGAFGGIRTAS